MLVARPQKEVDLENELIIARFLMDFWQLTQVLTFLDRCVNLQVCVHHAFSGGYLCLDHVLRVLRDYNFLYLSF